MKSREHKPQILTEDPGVIQLGFMESGCLKCLGLVNGMRIRMEEEDRLQRQQADSMRREIE